MLSFLPPLLQAPLSLAFLILNVLFWAVWLYLLIPLKLLSPSVKFRNYITNFMVGVGESWISVNNFLLTSLQPVRWQIELSTTLRKDCSYLICANHQSWTDILVLQKCFNRRIPFLRFFLKQELRYIPIMGGAWWALDFPFMKRYSREYLEKHPEKKGKDMETTRKACERFKGFPISVLNFFEGTRITEEKRLQQKSPFKNLLPPKAGGAAFVLEAMGEQFHSLLDVTIYYPGKPPSMWDLFCGRLKAVHIVVQERQIPQEFIGGNYLENQSFRESFQTWITSLWEQKDQLIEKMKS